MMRVILHSDDLGITCQSTNHLLEAWLAGHLDGFSIIANGDAVDQIPGALLATPERQARIAVHFNLTEGRSSAPSEEVPLLVYANGELRYTFVSLLWAAMFSRSAKRRELLRQIARECAAQIVAVRSICGARAVTAIDSHNHIHMIPGVFAAVAQAARDAGIPEIRISSEPFFLVKPWRDWLQPFWWINLIKHLLLRILSINGRRAAQRYCLKSPDAIIGVLYSGRMSASRALHGIEAAVGAAKVEIVFHIGRANFSEAARWKHSSYLAFHLSKWRDIERAEVCHLSELMRTSAAGLSMDSPYRDEIHYTERRNIDRCLTLNVYQFGRYLLVGGIMTVIGYTIIFFCMYGLGLNPIASNILAYGLGIVVSYWMNRTYTFRSKGKKVPEAVKFFIVFGFAYAANLIALALFISNGVHPAISQVIAGLFYVTVSFAANSLVAFKQ